MISIISRSICSGDVLLVSPKRYVIRLTCVSTTTPLGIPHTVPSTTLAVFASDAGQRHQIVQRFGDLAAKPLDHSLCHAAKAGGLGSKEACRANDLLEIGLRRGGQRFDVGVFGKQHRRHHVDALIGTLGREDRCHKQLVRRLVLQGAGRDRDTPWQDPSRSAVPASANRP